MPANQQILLLVSERVGDVIFTTPAIAMIAEAHPGARIDVIALSKAAQAVLVHNPVINQIHVVPSKTEVLRLAATTDIVFDLHNSKHTRRYCHWLERPTHVNPRKGRVHQSQVAVDFVAKLYPHVARPAPHRYLLYPQAHHHERADQLLQSAGVDIKSAQLMGCHMGCHKLAQRSWKWWRKPSSAKSWPVPAYAALINQLAGQCKNIKVVLTGVPSEAELGKALQAQCQHVVNLIGQTSVLALTALMQRFAVFLSGDTGPMHIACAADIPLVGLFAATDPTITGPYPQREHHIIMRSDRIEDIAVEDVRARLSRFLV